MSYSATSYPYDTVCYITDSFAQGSGVMISSDCVLTAAHVVLNNSNAVDASSIRVSPGYNDGPSVYGTISVLAYDYYTINDNGDLITSSASQYDFAVLHLSQKLTTGYMGIESNFAGGAVNVTGYPGNYDGTQVDQPETVVRNLDYSLLNMVALSPGSSGGPLWTGSASNPYVVGVVSSGSGSGTLGYAGLITTSVYNQIEAWVSAFDSVTTPPPAPTQDTIAIKGTVATGTTPPSATSVRPFSAVTITDSSSTEPVTIKITPDGFVDTARSTPSNMRYEVAGKVKIVDPSAATDGSNIDSTGAYTVSGTAATVTSIVQNLEATIPLPDAVSEATFAISASDPTGASASDTSTNFAFSAPINPNSVYRFFDTTFGTHFFTSSATERDAIKGTRPDLVQEVNDFGTATTGSASAETVYRFFDNVNGTHFFTASLTEYNTVASTRTDLVAEPSGNFLEHATQQAGDVAVYRFFDTKLGTHFYTGDANEEKGIVTAGASTYRPDLTYEGIAFYAPSGTYV